MGLGLVYVWDAARHDALAACLSRTEAPKGMMIWRRDLAMWASWKGTRCNPTTPRRTRKQQTNTSNIMLETGILLKQTMIYKETWWVSNVQIDIMTSRYDERDECVFIIGTIRLTIVCGRAFLWQCVRRDTKLLLRSHARLRQTDRCSHTMIWYRARHKTKCTETTISAIPVHEGSVSLPKETSRTTMCDGAQIR